MSLKPSLFMSAIAGEGFLLVPPSRTPIGKPGRRPPSFLNTYSESLLDVTTISRLVSEGPSRYATATEPVVLRPIGPGKPGRLVPSGRQAYRFPSVEA